MMKTVILSLLLLCVSCTEPQQTAPDRPMTKEGEQTCHECACEVNEWYGKYLLYEVQAVLHNNTWNAQEQLSEIHARLTEAKTYYEEELVEHGCSSTLVLDAEWPAPATCP